MVKELVYKYKVRGINHIENNNITGAINTLIQGVKISNKDIDLLNILGLCLYKKCKFNEAREVFKRSLFLDGNSEAKKYLEKMDGEEFFEFIKRYNKGIEELNNLELENALKIFIHINMEKKELIEPYVILIKINLYMERYKEAMNWVEALIKIDIGNEKITKYKEIIELNKK